MFIAKKHKLPNSAVDAYQLEIDKIIDYAKALGKQTLLRRLGNLLSDPAVSFILDMLNSCLNILCSVEFLWSTYDPLTFRNSIWGTANICVHIYFLLEYLLRLYSAKNRKQYFLSWESLIDVVSCVPFFLIRIATLNPLNEYNEQTATNLANLFSLIRILRLERTLKYIDSEINRQLLSIMISIITLILVLASTLQIAERSHDPTTPKEQKTWELDFHYYVYFILTAISTMGYENIFDRVESKVLIICLIFVAFFIIPTKSSQLIQLLSSKSMYARRRYKIVEETPHIVITGTVSVIAAADFFMEFFHPDHGDQAKHAVLLSPLLPDLHMENVIRNPDYFSNVFYIQGDPLQEKDLKRCQAEKAKAIIILCNKQSGDASEEDAKTILQAMVIKKFLKHSGANVRLCMQVLRPEGKTHYYLSLNKQTKLDQVICVEELKLSLLAKSCLCPGLVALIANLITSSGEPPKRSELEFEWLEEYWKGKQFEIYKTTLSNFFNGKSFSSVAAYIYKYFRAIFFAIEIGSGENSQIFPNPGNFIIPENQRVTAYIIAADKDVADKISNYRTGDSKLKVQATDYPRKNFSPIPMTTMNLLDNGTFANSTDVEDDEDSEINVKLRNENFKNFQSGEWTRIEERCHISQTKINLKDVTFITMENNFLATNHIVLCGMVPNLINFILPLRARYLEKYPPIVILHDKEPSEKQWSQIAFFPEIYYVKGTALNRKDLVRVNILKASKLVILSPNVEEVKKRKFADEKTQYNEDTREKKYLKSKAGKLSRDEEDLLDARTIFKFKAVNWIKPGIPIVTELVSPQNLAFLLPHPKDYALMRKFGYTQTPTFASGEIYLSSVIDSLICQAYYNSALITVLNQLIVGNMGSASHKKEDNYDIKASNLYHLPVPRAFVEQNFEKLFKYLTKHQNILPLGLYRLPGVKDNKFPYVCCNPDPTTILTEKDLVFILAQSNPPPSSIDWGAPHEKREEKKKIGSSNSDSTTSEDQWISNYDEIDKENKKQKYLSEESKIVIERIGEIITEINFLKEDTIKLSETLKVRQDNVIEKVRKVISQQISQIIPNPNDQINDEDELSSNSSGSSFKRSLEEKDQLTEDHQVLKE